MALILKDILSNITELSEGRRSEIEEVIFAPTIDYKCVTTMRLEDQAHEYTSKQSASLIKNINVISL